MYGRKFAFQNRLGQLAVGRKFTIFTVFYYVFEGKFQIQVPRGAYIWRGDLTEGFLRYDFGGLIFGGAYTWRGLVSEFYGSFSCRYKKYPVLCEHQCLRLGSKVELLMYRTKGQGANSLSKIYSVLVHQPALHLRRPRGSHSGRQKQA